MAEYNHKMGNGECMTCRAIVGLKKGYVMRRHLDPRAPSNAPRTERLCPAGETRNWSALDDETSARALAEWMSDS